MIKLNVFKVFLLILVSDLIVKTYLIPLVVQNINCVTLRTFPLDGEKSDGQLKRESLVPLEPASNTTAY